MKKLTKEELIAENARLQSELAEVNKDFSEYSNVARKNLAKTLGIYIERSNYYGTKETVLPEWSEIYARIGELRTIEKQKHDLHRIEAIEERIDFIMKKLDNPTTI